MKWAAPSLPNQSFDGLTAYLVVLLLMSAVGTPHISIARRRSLVVTGGVFILANCDISAWIGGPPIESMNNIACLAAFTSLTVYFCEFDLIVCSSDRVGPSTELKGAFGSGVSIVRESMM
jgi:hypothetical protein